MAQEPGNIYDAYYYQTGCGRPYERNEQWLQSFDAIAARIAGDLQPHTVLDAGCAMGFLVEGLRKRGVEAFGIDISEYAIQNTHPSIQPYCWVGSITDPFPQKYDLVITIEVLEHMPKADAEKAIENLCSHTDQVLFSSGYEDLREVTHLNLQPPEYWAAIFARSHFFRDVDYDATFLTPWSVLYRRLDAPVHRIIMDYERQINHLIQENFAVRQVNLGQRAELGQQAGQLAALHQQLGQIYDSKIYQAARRVQFLAPSGSRREKALLAVWDALASIKHRLPGGHK